MSDQCGTNRGYQRHLRLDQTPCEACRVANRDYIREWRRRNGRSTSVRVPLDLLEQAIRECTAPTADRLRAATTGLTPAAPAAAAGGGPS